MRFTLTTCRNIALSAVFAGILACSEAPDQQDNAMVINDPMARMNEYFVYEQSLAFLQHYRSQTEALYNSSIGSCDLNETATAAKRALLAKLIGLAASEASIEDLKQLQSIATQSVNSCEVVNQIATTVSEHAESAEQRWREVDGPRLVTDATAASVANAMIAGSERIIHTYDALPADSKTDDLVTSARIASTQSLLEYLDTNGPDTLGTWISSINESTHATISDQVNTALTAYKDGDIERGNNALLGIKAPLTELLSSN